MRDLVKTFISPVNQFVHFWHVIPDNDPDINGIDQYVLELYLASSWLYQNYTVCVRKSFTSKFLIIYEEELILLRRRSNTPSLLFNEL